MNCQLFNRMCLLLLVTAGTCITVAAQAFTIDQQPGEVIIRADSEPVATYVYQDDAIPRPYFKDVHAPGGIQVTRNHPPVKGEDLADHPTYHPGVWLAFGDISGADFWRNKAEVRHAGFVEAPWAKGNEAGFSVRNAYESDGKIVCREECTYRLVSEGDAYYLVQESRFYNDTEFVFGDQEEMGLGIRVRTEMTVEAGDGYAVNSAGQRNEKGAWGQQADWAAYAGPSVGGYLGALVAGHPDNFRQSWYHVRDYGLIIVNPFGRKAYTNGEASAVPVKPGEDFVLRYGVVLIRADSQEELDFASRYARYLELAADD